VGWMFDGLFWDNDGVLMDTEHLYYQANAEALERAGVELSLEDFCRISLRQGESVLSLATVAGQSDSEVAEIRRVRDEIYFRLLGEESRVIPGVQDTLERLHGRLPMAIVTSCRRENFLQMHRTSGLLGYFDFVVTREDYSASKPDPEPYRTACARAGLNPGRCLAIEDSERAYRRSDPRPHEPRGRFWRCPLASGRCPRTSGAAEPRLSVAAFGESIYTAKESLSLSGRELI
jgi:HAD superfamily hydrolase (TIGR01509 family)